jgi:DNA-binding transcriptional regulator of glucitol operon
LQHHIDDYATLGESEDHSHYQEIRESWSKIENFEQKRAQFEAEWKMDVWDWSARIKNGVIHFHVWSQNEVVDLLRYVGLSIEYVADVVPEMLDSFLVVARR